MHTLDHLRRAYRSPICSSFIDKETAATLAFDKAILTRCITKDGDVYDPAGTMTGGATNRGASSSSLLSTLSRVNQLKQQLSALNRELDQVNASLQTIKVNRRSLNEKQNEVELKSHSISLLKKKLESDPAVKVVAREPQSGHDPCLTHSSH